jgi:long-subunit fatty acid transport protein
MIKRLLVALSLFLSFVSAAQENTASPYSFYGLGEPKFKGTAEMRAMGGISVIPDSTHINLQNPAFYPHLKLTTLTTGASYANYRFKTNTDKEKARRTTLDYLAVGIPMGKFGGGFGLMPYTAVGYKMRTVVTDPTGTLPTRVFRYSGTGGLNKAFIGLGYEFTKGFTIGAEFGYYFGSIETSTSMTSLQNESTYQLEYGTRELNESKANGPGFNVGMAYTSKINKKLTFSASAMYSPESHINLTNEGQLATIEILSNGQTVVMDEQDIDLAETTVILPSKLAFGAAIGEARKWMVGAEVTMLQNNDGGNRGSEVGNVGYKDGMRYSFGGYYIPKYTSFSDYWKKITYRAGFRYEETGLIVNDKSINDAAVTLGLGLPLGGTFSNINIGFEYGKKGTRDAMLVEENYFNFTLGLSFNDRWFVKRKYE